MGRPGQGGFGEGVGRFLGRQAPRLFEALKRFRGAREEGKGRGFQGRPQKRGEPRGRGIEGMSGDLERIGDLIRRLLGERGEERARRPRPVPDAHKQEIIKRLKQRREQVRKPVPDAQKREILERLKKRREQEKRRVPKRGKHPRSKDSGF
jgi:hypothetical protein